MHKDTLEEKHVSHDKLKDSSMESSSLTSTTSAISDYPSEQYGWKSPFDQQRQQIIDSNWGGYALDLNLWKNSKSPVVQVRPSKISFDNKEYYGFLSDRLIGVRSSFLTRSPENGLYILSKCVLRKKNLTDITMLQYHRYLQYINISYNNISCLSALSSLPYLMYLDASHNKIKHLSNFVPPWYLTYVNLSYNDMTGIDDLKNCWSIVRLNLSHNFIENLSGLKNLKHLRYLDLSYNLIECVKMLGGLNIQELNLEGNCITSFKSIISGRGINILPNLRTILLGYNRLSTLKFFKNAYSLRFIDLKFNKITDLLEVLNLKGSILQVDFRGNACTKWPNYRNLLIYSIPTIKIIDGIEVFPAEKVTSATFFVSPLDLTAARKVAKLTLLEQLNISQMDAHVQPYDEMSPPLVVLTGPCALKKMTLALHVAQTIPDKVEYCYWHTTKDIYKEDNEYNGYIFINREEFNDMARRGEFLVILDQLGQSYGFHTNQIQPLISKNKVGLTEMNLNAVIEITKRYQNVKPILMSTQSVDLHRSWIQETFNVYTYIRDSVENLLILKRSKQQEEEETETASCILNFIAEILDEIMCRIRFPSYSIYVRPQGDRVTTTDIILESKTQLPKVVLKRSELIPDKKRHIAFKEMENDAHRIKQLELVISEEKHAIEELKVILDEQSNIIIDDEETKREMRRSKMFLRRSILKTARLDDLNNNDFNDILESSSSDEAIETTIGEKKADILKNTYIELVIKTRKLYLDYHESHPGFFYLVLLMDDYENTFNSLIEFIDESYTNQSYKKPNISKVEHFKQTAISDAIENIVNEIRQPI